MKCRRAAERYNGGWTFNSRIADDNVPIWTMYTLSSLSMSLFFSRVYLSQTPSQTTLSHTHTHSLSLSLSVSCGIPLSFLLLFFLLSSFLILFHALSIPAHAMHELGIERVPIRMVINNNRTRDYVTSEASNGWNKSNDLVELRREVWDILDMIAQPAVLSLGINDSLTVWNRSFTPNSDQFRMRSFEPWILWLYNVRPLLVRLAICCSVSMIDDRLGVSAFSFLELWWRTIKA